LQRLENQKQGKQIVVAETAVDLNEGEKRKLEDKFSKLLNKKIQLKINVNPSLVGGIKVSTDSTIYDASCFNYLNDLRRKI
jgi:F-type H+-transporting ATPase subunit delta